MDTLLKNIAGQVIRENGVLVHKTTGARIVAGATVRVCKDGVWAAGAGVLALEETDEWTYAPTQAETNCTQYTHSIDHVDAVSPLKRSYRTVMYTGEDIYGAIDNNTTGIAGALTILQHATYGNQALQAYITSRTLASASYLTAAGVRAEVDAALLDMFDTADSLEDIAGAVRSELALELSRVDAAVSSRLATASYTAAPSAATVAAEVRTNLATELARIDVGIGTRLASTSYTAPPSAVTIASEVQTAMTPAFNALDANVSSRLAASSYVAPPSAATVAEAVRTDLATELARIDVNMSTRLATTSYTAAPSASVVAAAVRADLATELARIDVGIGTRLSAASYTAPPTEAEVATAVAASLAADFSALAWPANVRDNFELFFDNGGILTDKTIASVTAPRSIQYDLTD